MSRIARDSRCAIGCLPAFHLSRLRPECGLHGNPCNCDAVLNFSKSCACRHPAVLALAHSGVLKQVAGVHVHMAGAEVLPDELSACRELVARHAVVGVMLSAAKRMDKPRQSQHRNALPITQRHDIAGASPHQPPSIPKGRPIAAPNWLRRRPPQCSCSATTATKKLERHHSHCQSMCPSKVALANSCGK